MVGDRQENCTLFYLLSPSKSNYICCNIYALVWPNCSHCLTYIISIICRIFRDKNANIIFEKKTRFYTLLFVSLPHNLKLKHNLTFRRCCNLFRKPQKHVIIQCFNKEVNAFCKSSGHATFVLSTVWLPESWLNWHVCFANSSRGCLSQRRSENWGAGKKALERCFLFTSSLIIIFCTHSSRQKRARALYNEFFCVQQLIRSPLL